MRTFTKKDNDGPVTSPAVRALSSNVGVLQFPLNSLLYCVPIVSQDTAKIMLVLYSGSLIMAQTWCSAFSVLEAGLYPSVIDRRYDLDIHACSFDR